MILCRMLDVYCRSQMPFTEAVIDEALRILTLLPLLVHKTLQNVELGGHWIPKDTPVSLCTPVSLTSC